MQIMTCKHLKDLYEICQTHRLRLSSTDLIRIVCPQCGIEEVCPSVLMEEYEARHHDEAPRAPADGRVDDPPVA
jgi:RNase P subunit RPR2